MPADILDPAVQGLLADIRKFEVKLTLIPTRLAAFPNATKYAWTTVKYQKANANLVPRNAQGIYAFVMVPDIAGLELAYLLYIGKTEVQDLRTRYNQYFREQRDPKGRPLVRLMLDQWQDYLEFRYVILGKQDVSKAEYDLLEASIPHANSKFSAEVTAAKKAW